jgi:hypothetical protein
MNARHQERHKIHLEELAGSFSLFAGDTQFDYMRVNDISPSGAGLLVSQSLPVGAPVRLTFTAGDWAVAVEGTVVWCRRQMLPLGSSLLQESFRLGVRFQNDGSQRNLMFFHASRSSLKPFH